MKNNRTEVKTEQMFHVLISPSWISLMILLLLLIMMHFASAATTAPGNLKFDHNTTGFVLAGSHLVARCSSCHVDSVFKGTPRDCASCHVAGNRMGAQSKTTKHVATSAPCERCHQTTAWTPVKYNHVGVAPGSCLTCHNGTTANGKPSVHMSTNDSCDACHKTIAWNQLTGGGTLPPNHLPTTQPCSTCHSAGYGPNSGVMKHTGIVSGCATCHSGTTFAVGMTPRSKASYPSHMPTLLDCSACHTSTTTFLVANLTTPPVGHLPTSQPCSTCHIGTGSAAFGPGSGVMTHTGISIGCANCHNGQVFTGVTPKSKLGLSPSHLPTNMACELCHSPGSTNIGGFVGDPKLMMEHTGIFGGCTNCHNGQAFAGTSPVSKPTGATPHLPTNMACELCHSPGSTKIGGFVGVPKLMMKHTGIVSGCASCHGYMGAPKTFAVGVTPPAQTTTPTHTAAGSRPCESCHSSTVSFTVAIGGTKPANHLPTTAACNFCHGTPYYPGIMNHTGIANGCTTCHNGQVFVGVTPKAKPVNHLPTSGACENCHKPINFSQGGNGFAQGVTMSHAGISGGCTNCHNGQVFAGISPKAKPSNHFPTSMSCETCHSTTVFTTFSGAAMKHTGIVSGCAACHNGTAYAGVTPVAKSTKHIPYATMLLGGAGMGCEFCHSKTIFTTFTTGLVSSTTMHNGSQGGGSGTCVGCHLTGQSWSASLQTESHNGASTAKDCSSSGCHRPRGGEGTAYLSW